MASHLLIRLEGPLQAWGDVSVDTQRPTMPFPTKSALTGLLASALGWTYRDAERTNALQNAIEYGVREDRRPRPLRDFQTVDLGRDPGGWTRWGYEKRGGQGKAGTHLMDKGYLADASFLVALSTGSDLVRVPDLVKALQHPARPLFLGRKSCLPSRPLAEGVFEGDSILEVLGECPVTSDYDPPPLRCWVEVTPEVVDPGTREVWDRRDFVSDLFAGSRMVQECTVTPPVEGNSR